jgi:hypothetical protein
MYNQVSAVQQDKSKQEQMRSTIMEHQLSKAMQGPVQQSQQPQQGM